MRGRAPQPRLARFTKVICPERDNLARKENVPLLQQILVVRDDIAHKLGYKSYADYETETKMVKNATDENLSEALESHLGETETHVERLEQAFEMLGKPARGKKCDAIEGIIDEGKEIMDEYADTQALDAGLLAAAQAVEHYEISRYGTLKAWAAKLNMPDAVKLLDQTLVEEKKTDEALSKLAEKAVNYEAAA